MQTLLGILVTLATAMPPVPIAVAGKPAVAATPLAVTDPAEDRGRLAVRGRAGQQEVLHGR